MNRRSQKSGAAAFLVLCLVAFIALLCLVPLGAICANAEVECPHKRKEMVDWVLPTCTEGGYDEFFCLDCGETFRVTYPAKEHKYYEYSYMYTKDGELLLTRWACAYCGQMYTEYVENYQELIQADQKSNTLPGWAIALIVIAAILAFGGVATGIALYWKKIKEND